MANSRQLIVTLVSDSKNFSKGFKEAQGDVGKFEKNMKGAQGETSKFASRTDVLRTSVGKLGGVMAATFAAGTVVNFARDSIRAASDLEQAIGGTEAVFGDASRAIDEFAESAAQAAGLSEAEFRTATTSIGGQLKRMTGDVEFAAETSVELTQVAADLAATYGGTTAEAVAALGSAFRGEADPAERFNLNLKAGAVSAKALELGLADSTKEIDEAARAQATIALIMEQSADAQGQFARESDTAAGSQQRLNAEFKNLQAEIGEALLPLWVQLLESARDMVPAAENLIPLIKDLADEFTNVVDPLIGIASNSKPVLDFLGEVTDLLEGRSRFSDGFGGFELLGDFLKGPIGLFGRAKDSADEFFRLIDDGQGKIDGFTTGLENHDDALRKATSGYGEVGDTVGSADEALLNMAKRFRLVEDEGVAAVRNLAGPLDGLVGDLLAAAEAAGNVYGVLRSASDPVFAAVDAWKSYQDAVSAATEDGTVTAQEELDLLAEKVDLRAALGELGSNYEEAMNALALATDTPIEKVEELFEALGLIDGKTFTTTVQTQFTTSGNPNPTNTGIEFRASGGPVSAGSPYVVGEQGPEVFVPGRSGMIHPNSALTGGGVNVQVAVNNPTTRNLDQDIQRGLLLSGISRWAEVN